MKHNHVTPPHIGDETHLTIDQKDLLDSLAQPAASQGPVPGLGTCEESFLGSYFTNANNSADIFHIKLPYKVSADTSMYHVKVRGYAYGTGDIIEITYVGYCYKPSNAITRTKTYVEGSSAIVADQYVGSDSHVYLKFKCPSVYYNSFRVDALHVGNGTVLTADDVEIIQDSTLTL